MKKLFTSIILCSIFVFTFGQNKPDSITFVKKALGTVFQQNGRSLTPKQLLEITSVNSDALAEMKIAKTNYDVGYVFGCAGGFLIGWPIGAAIAGGDANWTLAGIGAGLAIISIPFTSGYTKHAKNAIRLYNSSLMYPFNSKFEPKVKIIPGGVGVLINF